MTGIQVCAVCKECQGQMVAEGCGPYLPRMYYYKCKGCGRKAVTQHPIDATPHYMPASRGPDKRDYENRRIWTP